MSTVVHVQQSNVSHHSRLVAFFICFFFGYLGIHRLIVGKVGTGLLYMCTGGLWGIGWLIDIIIILAGSFTDSQGRVLSSWEGGTQAPVAQVTVTPTHQRPVYTQPHPQPLPPPPPQKSADEMFCNSCGDIVKKHETFCRNCGAALQH